MWMDGIGNGCLMATVIGVCSGGCWMVCVSGGSVLGVAVELHWLAADGFVHNVMFEGKQHIGHVMGGTFRSRATVRTANINLSARFEWIMMVSLYE